MIHPHCDCRISPDQRQSLAGSGEEAAGQLVAGRGEVTRLRRGDSPRNGCLDDTTEVDGRGGERQLVDSGPKVELIATRAAG